MFFLTMTDSSFDETVDNNPVIFENGSKARLLMNINEHAKYYKSLLLFPSPVFQRERLVASPAKHVNFFDSPGRRTSVCLKPK